MCDVLGSANLIHMCLFIQGIILVLGFTTALKKCFLLMGSIRDNLVKIEKYPVITLKYMCNFIIFIIITCNAYMLM